MYKSHTMLPMRSRKPDPLNS